MDPVQHRAIVACRIMQPELEKIRKQGEGVEILYLDQGLHMTPKKMAPAIQKQIDQMTGGCAEVVLGYGLCANGIVGVRAPEQGLYVPRSHDCIALFMGSFEVYRSAIKKRPGTFYLTAGWIEGRKDPLSYMEDRYVPRMGRQTAVWGMNEELRHYTHFVLINTGAGDLAFLRKQTLKNAAFFGKQYDEMTGSLSMFRKIVSEPLGGDDFFFITPGHAICQAPFIEGIGKASSKVTSLERPISLCPLDLAPSEVAGIGLGGSLR